MARSWPRTLTFLLLMMVGGARPSSTQPAQPGTQPAAPSTPKESLRAFVHQIFAEDIDAAFALIEPEDAAAETAARDYLHLCVADLRLARVASEAFGAREVRDVMTEGNVMTKDRWREVVLENLDAAREEVVDGQALILIDHAKSSPWPMKQVGDRWKIAWPAPRQGSLDETQTVVRRTVQIANDVESRRIDRLESLRTSLRSRFVFVGAAPDNKK